MLVAEDSGFAEFFAENSWLVGLSIDGTPPLHDANRPAPGGKGSYEAALKAAENLKAAGAEFNILTVVTDQTAKRARRRYSGYYSRAGISCSYPCIDSVDESGKKPQLRKLGTLSAEFFDCCIEI